jgi:hypothetical protein
LSRGHFYFAQRGHYHFAATANSQNNAIKNPGGAGRGLPTVQGRFLFGAMALIGWGTPVLTTAIAVVIELPEPVRIVLIARVSARLPCESARLVRINMDALGRGARPACMLLLAFTIARVLA